jgi:hypothetical protein
MQFPVLGCCRVPALRMPSLANAHCLVQYQVGATLYVVQSTCDPSAQSGEGGACVQWMGTHR